MKTSIPVIALALWLTGCATTQQTDSIATAARLSYAAARFGTVASLTEHPEWRPGFVAGQAALDSLLRGSNYNVVDFQKALQELPLNWLQDSNNTVYVSLGVFVWDSVTSTMFDVQSEEAVARVMQAIRDGVADGLVTVKVTDTPRRARTIPTIPAWPKSKTYLVL